MKIQISKNDEKTDSKNEIVLTRAIFLTRELDPNRSWQNEMQIKKNMLKRNLKRQCQYR